MPLSVSTDHALRSAAELRALVRAVRDASPEEMEQDWIEWKAAEKLLAKSCLVEIARHVIGFANRAPDESARITEGCAYLLFGVEPGHVAGADVIDIAQLDQGLESYLGTDGPRWSANYVDSDGHRILVITIEAPRWGERIHTLRKAYNGNERETSYAAGTVFVRKNGRTVHPPDPATMDMLQARLLRGGVRLALAVSWVGGATPTIPALDTTPDSFQSWLTVERRRLLAPLVVAEQRRAMLDSNSLAAQIEQRAYASSILGGMEQRSPEQYRTEVDTYLERAAARLPAKAQGLAVEKLAPELTLTVTNGTDRNFREVQVDIHFAGVVTGYIDQRDIWKDVDFPRAPTLYGTVKPIPDVFRDYANVIGPYAPNLPRAWAENSPGRCRLRFTPMDLRPHYMVDLPSFRLLALPEAAGKIIPGYWHATATSADGLIEGRLDIAIDPAVVSAATVLDPKSG